jgi:sulfite reductase alpha subunit-like flavoprotein
MLLLLLYSSILLTILSSSFSLTFYSKVCSNLFKKLKEWLSLKKGSHRSNLQVTILYSSVFGTAKKFAEDLYKRLGSQLFSVKMIYLPDFEPEEILQKNLFTDLTILIIPTYSEGCIF